jgi:hypothetical protein
MRWHRANKSLRFSLVCQSFFVNESLLIGFLWSGEIDPQEVPLIMG